MMRHRYGAWSMAVSSLLAASAAGQSAPVGAAGGPFQRIASFPVFENTDVELETVAEIVASADGGNLLVYTDSETENLGFVDISDPANPTAAGIVALGGEPTSVAVRGRYALVCINTSEDFVNTSGDLLVIDVFTRQIVESLPLGGQPDAIAVSPNGRFAAVAIENERDEDLGDGEPPQLPPGFVVIVDLTGPPSHWSTRTVDLVGIPDLFPEDPEPEFVDINAANLAVVTLQENNHIVVIFLPTGRVVADFPAGTVDLDEIDILENDLIQQDASLQAVPREPDAVAWTSLFTFATADEGDLFGGSRGFTTWRAAGYPLFRAGNTLEHAVARIGHYPEGRSENKGNEPEGVEFGRYGNKRYLFVGSERSSVVFVYELFRIPFIGNLVPQFKQVLPTGVAPEGLLAIPNRDLFVVACEDDARDDKIRSTIMIYARTGQSTYPTLVSANRDGAGVPIPWGALSGLATSGPGSEGGEAPVYAVHDSFYKESRVYTIDRSGALPRIVDETVVRDSNDSLIAALEGLKAQLPGTDDYDPASLINADGSVNLDLEGIALDPAGNAAWLASEGRGNLDAGVSDPDDRPFESPNVLVKVNPAGEILTTVLPPLEVTRNQFRFGFEGAAAVEGDESTQVYVCFQRAWQNAGDPSNLVRIGRYDVGTGYWRFAHYPLDMATSPAGGWVGLSDLTYLGDDRFAVIERDNQGGPDAAVKRIYEFSVDGVQFVADGGTLPVLDKELVIDLLDADVYGPTGGLVPEKLEGLAVLPDGSALIVNDNDGVDDNSGETQLIELDGLFD